MGKKFSKNIRLAMALCSGFVAAWTQAPHSVTAKQQWATPCSCWDSGTTVYMGAKCHAAWESMEDTLGIPLIVGGIKAMNECHKLCNKAHENGASGYSGNEWWYADPTAYYSCLK